MRIDVILLGAIFCLFLCIMYCRTRNITRNRRRAIYDDCLTLFSDVSVTQDDVNYPLMHARYNGIDIVIEPLVDHIAVRKIPVLWLIVSIKSPVPYTSTLDYLVRPQNTEFYSPSGNLHTSLDIPADWPQHAALRTDNIDDIPPVDVVGRCVSRVFEDPRHKELLITPKGLRIVYLADEAQRSHYMVLRQLVFDKDRLERLLVKRLIDTLIELLDDLSDKPEMAFDKKVNAL